MFTHTHTHAHYTQATGPLVLSSYNWGVTTVTYQIGPTLAAVVTQLTPLCDHSAVTT